MNEQGPVTISIVGTGTGDGGGVAPTPSGTIATTPGTQPDLRINVITPIVAIAVRFGHLFLTTYVGLVTAALTPLGQNVIKAGDFGQLLWTCAGLSISVPVVGLLRDCITIFGRLEGKYPLRSGSI